MSEKYSTITINGESFRYPAGTLYSQVAADFEKKIGEMILLVKENHRLRELRHTVKDGSEVSFITYQDKQGRIKRFTITQSGMDGSLQLNPM